jgi:hypothetical protein
MAVMLTMKSTLLGRTAEMNAKHGGRRTLGADGILLDLGTAGGGRSFGSCSCVCSIDLCVKAAGSYQRWVQVCWWSIAALR